MRLSAVIPIIVVIGILLEAQTKIQRKPAPQLPPQKDEVTSAREATDMFLNGLKLASLPEGRQLMSETQWITGEADFGQNFYYRPRYTEVTALFEKLFDTDLAEVQGYKRLLEMKAVSEAGTPLLVRYFMVAFKDRRTSKWKILVTGTEEDADVDKQIAFFGKKLGDTRFTSEQSNYLAYGRWLLVAGRTKEAREALTTAMHGSAVTPTLGQDRSSSLHQAQIQALSAVIDSMTAN